LTEQEIRKAVSFTIASKIKSLPVNVAKEVGEIYNENYKSLKMEIKEDYEDRSTSHACIS
jgi:hypothetical protein